MVFFCALEVTFYRLIYMGVGKGGGGGRAGSWPPLDFYFLSFKPPKFQNSSIFSN